VRKSLIQLTIFLWKVC